MCWCMTLELLHRPHFQTLSVICSSLGTRLSQYMPWSMGYYGVLWGTSMGYYMGYYGVLLWGTSMGYFYGSLWGTSMGYFYGVLLWGTSMGYYRVFLCFKPDWTTVWHGEPDLLGTLTWVWGGSRCTVCMSHSLQNVVATKKPRGWNRTHVSSPYSPCSFSSAIVQRGSVCLNDPNSCYTPWQTWFPVSYSG